MEGFGVGIVVLIPAMTKAETVVLAMIEEAAENQWPCPVNIDLEVAAGFSSCSMGSKIVRLLERKGLVIVERSQKARRVQVIASGKWTAWPSWHKAGVVRMDRGAHDDSFLIAALVALGVPQDAVIAKVGTLQDMNRLAKDLERCVTLAGRRISGMVRGEA